MVKRVMALTLVMRRTRLMIVRMRVRTMRIILILVLLGASNSSVINFNLFQVISK